MSAILNIYKDNVDYTWYDSSNVLYSECYDKDNDLKDLKIVFKGGRSYLYEKIDVNDYLMFRSDLSQGKALNKYIIVKDRVEIYKDFTINLLYYIDHYYIEGIPH